MAIRFRPLLVLALVATCHLTAAATEASAAAPPPPGPEQCAAAFARELSKKPRAHLAAPPAVFLGSLRRFRAAMVEHGAPLGVDAFHALRGDTQVEATPWTPLKQDAKTAFPAQTRTVRFVTAVDAPFGPKETRAEKVQVSRNYGDDCGTVLETQYFFKDIPMGDSFHVIDRWVVEADGAVTRAVVSFELVWTKRCFMKSVVDRKCRADIEGFFQDWFARADVLFADTADD